MADFCWQCTEELHGKSLCSKNDLRDQSFWFDTYIRKKFPIVLCEGCGLIQVDHKGRCVSKDCYKRHREK
jgi:hypothetical protein